MATQVIDELQAEAPPSKRARLEQSEDLSATPVEVMDDVNSAVANSPTIETSKNTHAGSLKKVAVEYLAPKMGGIPGLGLLGQAPKTEPKPGSGGRVKYLIIFLIIYGCMGADGTSI